MGKDGVVSISIDYKKELNQMVQDYESALTEMASSGQLSKGMKKQFDDTIAELKAFKTNMEKAFSDLNIKGVVNKNSFNSFKETVNKNFESVYGEIDRLDSAVSNINSQIKILGGDVDISKISNQFKDFQDYVQNTHNAIDAMIKELGDQGISLMSFDQASINSAIDGVKKLENIIKSVNSKSRSEYDLNILNLNEEELQKEADSISATIEHLKDRMDSLKKDMENPNIGGIQLTKIKAEYEALSLSMKDAYDKMEEILNSEDLKFQAPEFSDVAMELEDLAEYEDDIDKFIERAKLAKKELQSIVDSTKRPSAKMSDQLDPNSAQIVAGVTIETTSSELWKILSPILDGLQNDLNSNPVVAPVKLVVSPTAVSSEKTGEVGGITKNYSKKYQKVLAETGEDAVIDLEGVYKKTFTSIMDEAVSYAKETIEKIQNIFESTPIDVKFNMSQEELDKIQNFVLSNKDGEAIDISGQVTKTKTEVKELAEGLEKVKEILSSTDGKKVSFEGFDKFQEDISSSLAQLVEFKDMLQTLQSMESILSKATGISGTTELTTQWELVSKLITNAIKLDGTFRKNANIGKVAYEYNKYLNMGGTNEIFSIDKVAKLEDSANIINTILAKVKELNTQKVDTGSVNKADDELKSVSSTLDDVISRLDHLVNLTRDIGNTFYKMFKEASISDVDKQWSAIESKFKSIADESGKINLSKQKKDVQELMEMYQKYSNAGGMKTPFDLTDNAETIKKLNRVYEQINSGSGSASVSKESKGFESVKKSVDDLTTSINTKTDAIKTEVNTMELAARAEVKSIQKIIDALTPLIEKIKGIPELKIPKAEKVDSVAPPDSNNKSISTALREELKNRTNISSSSTESVTDNQIKKQNEYNDLIAIGYDRIQKMKKISEGGTTGSISAYELLRLNHDAWDEVKANNFFNTIPEEGLERYTKILEVVEKIVQEMVQASGLTEDQIVSQLKDIETAQGGNFKLSSVEPGWTHFATYSNGQKDSTQKVNGITYKVYAAFDDIKDLNQNVVSSIMDELTKAGFKGKLKTTSGSTAFGNKLNGLAITDQMVIHGSTKEDQEIAYNTLKNMGLKLSYLSGGIDTPDGSFSQTLANGEINKYIQGLERESETAQDTAKAERQLAEARKESTSTVSQNPMKDAFQGETGSGNATEIKENLDEVVQDFQEASDSSNKFSDDVENDFNEIISIIRSANQGMDDYAEKWKILKQKGRVGDNAFSAKFQKNDGQIEDWYFQKNGSGTGYNIVARNLTTNYDQFEKIIIAAENKLRDLEAQKESIVAKTPFASTDGLDKQIAYQKAYVDLLDQTAQYLRQNNETVLKGAQIENARNQAAQEYYLKKGTKNDIANAKQLSAEEKKREANIEQTNRLLNKQQITIDTIEKKYNKTVNPDLTKSVNNPTDLADLANKKVEIQKLINQLTDQGRNNSNEDDYLKMERLVAEYRQLASDKLKSNNPSQQEMGAKELSASLEKLVSQYNLLIAKSESYGGATAKLTERLKAERDVIAKFDTDRGVYAARSDLKANQYTDARNQYQKSSYEFSSKKSTLKNNSVKEQQQAVNQALKDQISAWKQIQSIREKIAKEDDPDDIEQLQKTKKHYQEQYLAAQKIVKANQDICDYQAQVNELSQIELETTAKINNYKNESFKQQKANLVSKIEPYTNETKYTSDFVSRVKSQIAEINGLEITNPQDVARLEDIEKELTGIISDSNLLENKLVKQKSKLEDIISQMKIYGTQNTNMSSAQKSNLQTIIDTASEMNESEEIISQKVEDIKVAFSRLKAEVAEAGNTGKNFFSQIGNRLTDMNSKFIAQFLSWQDWIRYIQQAAEAVIELNTNITELAKVSEQTTKQIYSDFDSYADIAKEMGATISDTISATADWSRNGYNIPDSKELAEVALLYKNVGDGIDIDTANESLISTLQGFKLEADQAEHIVDVFNEVSNNEAISSSGIGEALQNSAAAFNAANTSLEESVALVSATNSVLQDPDKVGDTHIADLYSNVMEIKSSYIG